MFSKIRNLAPLALVGAFLQSPQGRAAVAKAKSYAADPNNRAKIVGAVSKLARRP